MSLSLLSTLMHLQYDWRLDSLSDPENQDGFFDVIEPCIYGNGTVLNCKLTWDDPSLLFNNGAQNLIIYGIWASWMTYQVSN